jgi:hypothetical protein
MVPIASIDRARRIARARTRAKSAGAAMFIVAITLAMLAAMGVYGLSATAIDVRAAGHLRESVQAQSAAEHAVMLTAESFTPGTAGELVRAMQSGKEGSAAVQATTCKTSNAFDAAGETNSEYRAAQACLSLNVAQMQSLSTNINPWTTVVSGSGVEATTFGADSLGPIANKPYMRIEVTNPVDIAPPPGTALNDRSAYTEVTATVFIDMKASKDVSPDTVVLGRGRLIVGPYFRQ